MMKEQIELKPCPFCGGEGRLMTNSECEGFGCYSTYFFVACRNCGATGGKADSYFEGSNEKHLKLLAIINWERRSTDGKADGKAD